MDKIEEVARAIYEGHAWNDNHDSINPGFDGLRDDWKATYSKMARAAIAAMRTPSEKMVEAGQDSLYDTTEFASARDVYTVMIDAALEE